MRQVIKLDISHSIEFDNSHVLSEGNYANVYYAHVVQHEEKKKRRFFICGKGVSDDHIETDEVIIKIVNVKSREKHSKAIEIENEIQLLSELENEPNIVHIKKYGTQYIYRHGEFVGLECCKGGDLFNFFQKRRKLFNEPEVTIILLQIIEAVCACHRHGIVHGDIKLENIGLVRPGDISNLKLLDFGGSHKIEHPEDEIPHTAADFGITASPHYISPELASSEIFIKECELIYTDFWEIGIICYILLTGQYPFGKLKSSLKHIKKCVLYDELRWPKEINVSPKMKQYVENLLKKKPQDRCLQSF